MPPLTPQDTRQRCRERQKSTLKSAVAPQILAALAGLAMLSLIPVAHMNAMARNPARTFDLNICERNASCR
jgi:hypothetical protein